MLWAAEMAMVPVASVNVAPTLLGQFAVLTAADHRPHHARRAPMATRSVRAKAEP